MQRLIIIKLFFGLCLFCSSTVFTQNINPENFKSLSIDSTLSWLQENTYSGKNLNEFHAIALQSIEKVKGKTPDSTKGKLHESLASWHDYNGLFAQDSTVYHAEKALEYFKSGTDQKRIADSYRSLAIDYLNARRNIEAQEVLFKSIDIYEELEDEASLGKAYRTLGVLYQVMEDYEKCIEYTLLALPLFEKAENYSSLAIAQFNLIIGYGNLGEFQKAYDATERCLEIVRTKAQDEKYVPIRAYSYRGEVYVKDNKYDKALEDYMKAWTICKAEVGEERCRPYRTEVGQVYLLQKEYNKALEHLLDGINAYEEKDYDEIIQPYLDVASAYEGLGDYKNALYYKEKANINSKNILEDKIENIESELAIKYETEKKNETLASQASLIEQKNTTQTLIIFVACLLLLFLIFLLYFFDKNKKKTEIIKAKNAENELLLKEIHHRVKNNLEMVKSLIALQSAQIEDETTRDAMIASQNRVQSMGIIHQKLYQGDNLGSIEMKDYFLNLGEGILDTFNAEDKVKIECAMDNLDLDVDTAVPIGLIVNELLTNALKYAFPDKDNGVINISLEKKSSNVLQLKVQDNGVGKTKGLAPKGTGFGSQLVQLLTQQLNGKMNEKNEKGTYIEFNFQLKQSA
jgi:two-component sensor histidine kinase